MLEAVKDVLLYQAAPDLPFYSQVLCSFHRNNDQAAKKYPEDRTLFLRSLDPALGAESIKRGLSSMGTVELHPVSRHVGSDHDASSSTRHYHAVMANAREANRLIGSEGNCLYTAITAKSHIPKGDDSFLATAISNHRAKYRGMDILQKNADECLMQYDIEEEIQNRLDREVTMDDDGFVLVKTGPDAVKPRRVSNIKRKREAATTTIDFYRFPNKEPSKSSLRNLTTNEEPY